MKQHEHLDAVCPRCGTIYNERPAISRQDNSTAICPDCGTREALMTLGIEKEEQDKIIRAIHGFRNGE
jgi:DNA-directed RNA polymerase subunit RPC12/RpoP